MKKFNLLFITLVAAIGGLLFGYDTGVINATQIYFTKFFDMNATLQGWVVGSALVGCFFGSLIAGPITKQIGRRDSMILSAILFTLSAWGSGLPSFLPQSVDLLVIFRIIGGMGIGIASINAPTYIAELSPARIRGKMVTLYQLAIVIGFFVVFIVNYLIGQAGNEAYNLNLGWRNMFWSELIPCFLFLVLLFFVPKSPRWLVMKGYNEKARRVLENIHGKELASQEIQEIEQSIQLIGKQKFTDLFKTGFLSIVLIGCALSALQQLTGINAVLYYGADIFEKALGYNSNDVLKQQVWLASVNLLCTFIALGTVDKLGRKPLLYLGSSGMVIGFILLGFSIQTGNIGIISLIGILLFIGSFALSMGPIVWVLLAEMFPNNIRSMAISIAVSVQWAMNYVVTQMFPIVMESDINKSLFWNGSLPYFIFVLFIILIVFLTYKLVPETKGKSLEELENIWSIPKKNKE